VSVRTEEEGVVRIAAGHEDRRESGDWRALPALSFSRHCSSNAAAACSSAALSAGEATAAGISGESTSTTREGTAEAAGSG